MPAISISHSITHFPLPITHPTALFHMPQQPREHLRCHNLSIIAFNKLKQQRQRQWQWQRQRNANTIHKQKIELPIVR